MDLRSPPETGNPNLDMWLGEFDRRFSDSATILAGLSKSAGANFDWNGKQLVNIGGIHIGGISLPGKGNLIVDSDFNIEAGGHINVKSGGDINLEAGGGINVKDGGDINLDDGGDIILSPSDANPAMIKWSTTHNLGASVTVHRGLCIWPTVADQEYFKIGYDPVADADQRYYRIYINAKSLIELFARQDVNNYTGIDVDGMGKITFISRFSGTTSLIDFYDAALYPDSANAINLGKSTKKFNQGWFADYIIAEGGVHVGGTSDPGTDNLVVDGFLRFGDAGGLTLNAAGAITVTKSFHTVDTYGGASTDNLQTINGGNDGDVLILRAQHDSHTVVVKDYVGAPGNIWCGADFSMDHTKDLIVLICDSGLGGWLKLSSANNV